MTTTLANCRIELSKQIRDYWAGTTTGAGSSTTLVDTALKAKSNDWVTDETFDLITEGTYIDEERKVSSLDNTSGTLTVLAHSNTPGSGIDYEVHRMFTASEKRIALVAAARQAFPYIHKVIRDESKVAGNWLKDGSLEAWTTSTALTNWVTTTCTSTQTSSAGNFVHGSYSAALTSTAGSISQTIAKNEDLKYLAGKAVTFTVRGKTDTASSLRIGIYDGTTTTYSSYVSNLNGWTAEISPITVTATIGANPSAVTFFIYHDSAAATDYVDDARVIGPDNPRIYIGDLSLPRNLPRQVFIEPENYYQGEHWGLIHGIKFDTVNGYMTLPREYGTADLRLRILGAGYLDFLASGVSSTAWAATIAIDSPQTDILVAQAILYLYTQMALPNFSTNDRKSYQEMIGFWKGQLDNRIALFGMMPPPATINWSNR